MANTKSALKRWRQSLKRRLRNRVSVGSTRTAIKIARESIAVGAAGSADAVRSAVSRLDAAAQKGAIHPNAAARKKSRLQRALNTAPAPVAVATPEAVIAEAKPKRAAAAKKATTPVAKKAAAPVAKKAAAPVAKKAAAPVAKKAFAPAGKKAAAAVAVEEVAVVVEETPAPEKKAPAARAKKAAAAE